MSLSFTRPARAESSAGVDGNDSADVQSAALAPRRRRVVAGDLGAGWGLRRLSAEDRVELCGVPSRASCEREEKSVAVARAIAEHAHEGEGDGSGRRFIVHVGRVAAGTPLLARSVGRLQEVVEQSRVDEATPLAPGATPDECLALRSLTLDGGVCSDQASMKHMRVIALSGGSCGRIARAVKRADLRDP